MLDQTLYEKVDLVTLVGNTFSQVLKVFVNYLSLQHKSRWDDLVSVRKQKYYSNIFQNTIPNFNEQKIYITQKNGRFIFLRMLIFCTVF